MKKLACLLAALHTLLLTGHMLLSILEALHTRSKSFLQKFFPTPLGGTVKRGNFEQKKAFFRCFFCDNFFSVSNGQKLKITFYRSCKCLSKT